MSDSSGRKRSHDGDDPSGKKMKNREAARKCREKKVKETEDLKKKNDELMDKNKELTLKKMQLERKLQECIGEIERHKTSGCILPRNVVEIIESSKFSTECITDGTVDRNIEDSAIDSSRTERFQDDADSDVPAEEIQPTIRGLFNGKQLPANPVGRSNTRTSSSRSPSRSPPAPPVSLNGNPILNRSSPSSSAASPASSSRNLNAASKLMLQPTWHQLHQQTLNGQVSPGLSPAQTVPNIDSDWYMVPDTYIKQNGFPDIEEAVRNAQKEPGIMEDVEYNSHHQNIANFNSQMSSTTSIGFTPSSTTPSSTAVPSFQFSYNSSLDNSGIKNSPRANLSFLDSLKPVASSSMTVSMNHTAELLSQAITNNFDASEISEDLKKQYVQLAKNQENKVIPEESRSTQDYVVHNEQYTGEENSGALEQVQTANVTPMQTVGGSDKEITVDTLLRLAKDQTNITVQYQGREYTCNYDQVEQLIALIGSQQSGVHISDDSANDQTENYYSESLPPQVMTNNLLNQTNNTSYIIQNPTFTPQTDLTIMHDTTANVINSGDIVPVSVQAPTIETHVQSTFLPTTVLSMIEKDSQQSQNQSTTVQFNETYVDSVDYSENVKDLPSLSLTEDHTNIFEKKRRTS